DPCLVARSAAGALARRAPGNGAEVALQELRFGHTPRKLRRVLDHVGINVSDLQASRAFYERALEPLGFAVRTLAAGGRDNGAPGLSTHYNDSYYDTFVRDAYATN